MPNWKDLKLSMKRLVLAWIKTQPGAVLMLTRATMQAGVQLMRKMLHLASLAWEKQQQLEASRGRPRSYRVLEAWQNDDVRSAFTALRDCFHSPLPALPLAARTNSMKVLGFRLLARVAGALHLLLRVTRAGFPHRLFSLLQPATSQERLDLAEKAVIVSSLPLGSCSQAYFGEVSDASKADKYSCHCDLAGPCIDGRE